MSSTSSGSAWSRRGALFAATAAVGAAAVRVLSAYEPDDSTASPSPAAATLFAITADAVTRVRLGDGGAVEHVASAPTGPVRRAVRFGGGLAVLTQRGQLHLLDAHLRPGPRLDGCADVACLGDRLVVYADGVLRVLDASLSPVGALALPRPIQYPAALITCRGDVAYVATFHPLDEGSLIASCDPNAEHGLARADLSDPTAPALIAHRHLRDTHDCPEVQWVSAEAWLLMTSYSAHHVAGRQIYRYPLAGAIEGQVARDLRLVYRAARLPGQIWAIRGHTADLPIWAACEAIELGTVLARLDLEGATMRFQIHGLIDTGDSFGGPYLLARRGRRLWIADPGRGAVRAYGLDARGAPPEARWELSLGGVLTALI